MCVVAGAEVVEGYSPRPSNALCYVLAGHLQMDASRVATFLLVNVKECPHLGLMIIKHIHVTFCLSHMVHSYCSKVERKCSYGVQFLIYSYHIQL